MVGIIALGIVGLFLILKVWLTNYLIGRKNQIDFAWSSIDAQLKKRYDLIPNLVATCERYMQHERELLSQLTQIRTEAMQHQGDVAENERKLSKQLFAVLAIAENYPNLKASKPFVVLQQALAEVEAQLAAARRAYNAAVTQYNNACQMFPTSIIAKSKGFCLQPWFEVTEQERQQVKIWQ